MPPLPTLKSGYAYEWRGTGSWRSAPNDDWDTIVITPTGDEKYVGTRFVDGSEVGVFRVGKNHYHAQLVHFVSNPKRVTKTTTVSKTTTRTNPTFFSNPWRSE